MKWRIVPVDADSDPHLDMSIAFAEAFYAKRRVIDEPNINDWWQPTIAASPSPLEDGELVERVARALAVLDGFDPDEDANYVSERIMTDVAYPPEARLWWRYRITARSILKLLYEGR